MTLENKLGITSSAELATQEERLSKKRALELFESGMLDKRLIRKIICPLWSAARLRTWKSNFS